MSDEEKSTAKEEEGADGEATGRATEDANGEAAPPAPELSPRAKRIGRVVMLVVTLMFLEITSCVGGRILAARGTFYVPPQVTAYDDYMKHRDPVLGWPARRELPELDASGSRVVPAFPDPATPSCISLYGDSFTFGEEVDHEHAWGNQLAKGLGCRVANYGFPGHGSDQAYLRYREKKGDASKIVLLGILTENIMRNVNTFRALLAPKAGLAFKPRFVAGDDGALTLAPLVAPTEDEMKKIVLEPEKYLKHEYFVPGGPTGNERLRFPYTASLLGLLGNWRIKAAIRGVPSHAEFYAADHPSRGLAVTAGIAKLFAAEAEGRGAWGGVVIIPLPTDLAHAKEHGKGVHQPLVDELARAKIPHVDTTEKFLATLAGKDPCTLYTRCAGGHFNEQGYLLLAQYVEAWLKEQGKR